MIQLPISQDGSQFQFSTELDGVTFTFEFRWNDRDEAWFMTIGDGEGSTIVSGIKVVINAALPANFKASRLPGHPFVAIDTAGLDQECGFADLGRRVVIFYNP